jgi:membrane-associated protein
VLNTLLDALRSATAGWPVPLVLAVAAALLVVESGTLVGMALPGTTLLVALGLWAHVVPGSLVPAIVAAAVGTVAGAQLSWWRGLRTAGSAGRGPAALRSRVAQARHWLAGRGPAATATLLAGGHWAAAARPIMPRVAGGAGVPYRLAGPVLTVSGAAWAATLVVLGNRVGPTVLTHAGWAPIVLVVLIIATLVARTRRAAVRPPAAPAGRLVA